MSSLLALLPPLTSGSVEWPNGPEPVYSTLRYWRTKNPRNGRNSYWHIPRSARRLPDIMGGPSRVHADFWCGQGRSIRDSDLEGEAPGPVCATCMGRAIGSGQFDNPLPEDLIFTPRWFLPPEQCPSRYAYVQVTDRRNRVRCLVCHAVERWAGGYWGNSYTRPYIAKHDWDGPSSVSIRPCDFHGWSRLGTENGAVVCTGCGDRFGMGGPYRPLGIKTFADVT